MTTTKGPSPRTTKDNDVDGGSFALTSVLQREGVASESTDLSL